MFWPSRSLVEIRRPKFSTTDNHLNDTARISLYQKQWYNEDKMNWRDRAFLEDGCSFQVDQARLRLQRSDPLRNMG